MMLWYCLFKGNALNLRSLTIASGRVGFELCASMKFIIGQSY